jgi:hypothetical protein
VGAFRRAEEPSDRNRLNTSDAHAQTKRMLMRVGALNGCCRYGGDKAVARHCLARLRSVLFPRRPEGNRSYHRLFEGVEVLWMINFKQPFDR